ncbi:MAG TPA: hypothetical protein VJ985_07700 [Gammaproteobacteria bacterium]|nr:hypothetical protein [Gammaproteobacteria bacterium]
MIEFTARIDLKDKVPPARVECHLDRNYRRDDFPAGSVVHDGRVSAWTRDGSGWNGSFLAWQEGTPTGSPGLTLYLDRFGSIPVYLARNGDELLLASSLRFFAQEGFRRPEANAALQVVLLGMPFGRQTLLEGVQLLPPASRLVVDGARGEWQVERYWWPSPPAEEDTDRRNLDATVAGLVERLCNAQERIPAPAHYAYPVTAGLDSRVNIAAGGERVGAATLVHCGGPGDAETPISRRIAEAVGSHLELVGPLEGLAAGVGADPFTESGELSTWQWWLSGIPGAVVRHGEGAMLVDGYLQDVLFNPHLVQAGQVMPPWKRYAHLAAFRWRILLGERQAGEPQGLVEALQEAENLARGDSHLATEQNFYLENRSRRYTLGTVRLAQNHLRVGLPGLDHDLVDFGLALPWRWREGGALYRRAIQQLSPALARVPEGKTGLPLTSERRHSLPRTLKRLWGRGVGRYIRRLAPVGKGTSTWFTILVARDPAFRRRVRGELTGSEWLPWCGVPVTRMVDRLSGSRLGPTEGYLICQALTLTRLERVIRGQEVVGGRGN